MKKIVIAGSFASYNEMKELARILEKELKVKCVLPRHFRGYKDQEKIEELKRKFKTGKIKLKLEDFLKIGKVENWFLRQIEEADVVLVYNKKKKEGEVGINTTMDIGYALGRGKKLIFLYPPTDAGLRGFLTYKNGEIKVVNRDKVADYLKKLVKEI